MAMGRGTPDPLAFLTPILAPDTAKKLTWTPNREDGWQVSHSGKVTADCRISGGKLLQKRYVIGGAVHWVLNPVSPD